MATEYLGVKQVAERLGITSGGLLNLKLPEPDAMIGRTRGWLPETIDGWNAKRPGRGVGGGRPRKHADFRVECPREALAGLEQQRPEPL